MLTRRELMKAMAANAALLGGPTLALATADTDARFVLVILRGAMDGLAFAPPYGDGHYAGMRGELALAGPGTSEGVLKLDGLFGLHPSLQRVHRLYTDGEAAIVHAVATPYRDRSHFDGQDVLETGAARPGQRDGWLNRALASLGGSADSERAIALAQNTPLVLRGLQSVTSWAPSGLPEASDDTLERLAVLYESDEFFRVRLARALDARDVAGDAMGSAGTRRRGNDAARFAAAMRQAARFLTTDPGPRIAVLESGGWDTHANQGAARGGLANRYSALDAGIAALVDELGETWRRTVLVVATEFGRTVAVNGTRGTDHGTATAALVAGGAVRGGSVVADWPGLARANLYQNRDLLPTTDLRGVFKAVLRDHLGLVANAIEKDVFPDSRQIRAIEGLIA